MLCPRCGKENEVQPFVPPKYTLGDIFYHRYAQAFRRFGCRCNDVAALLTRYGPKKTLDRIQMLSEHIAGIWPEVDRNKLRTIILESVEEYNGQDA